MSGIDPITSKKSYISLEDNVASVNKDYTQEEIDFSNISLSVSSNENDEEYFNALNEAMGVDYEEYMIDLLEQNVIQVQQNLDKQDDSDGWISDIYNGIKELTTLGVSKSEVISAIQNQKDIIEKLKQAHEDGNFKDVYQELTGVEYDEEKVAKFYQRENEVKLLQAGLEKINVLGLNDNEKEEKINQYIESFESLTSISSEELMQEYNSLASQTLGSANELIDLLNNYIQSQESFIDKTANVAQIGGIGLMAVGGVACFIPGGQAVGAFCLKAGQIAALGGTFGDNALELVDTMTNEQNFEQDKEKYKEISKETFVDAALFLSGYGAGSAANLAGNAVLSKTGSVALQKIADIGVDASLSLLSDYIITGEIDIVGEGLSQLLSILTGSAYAKINQTKTEINTIKVDQETPKMSFNPESGELEAPKIKGEIESIELDHQSAGDSVSSALRVQQFTNEKLTLEQNQQLSQVANKLSQEYANNVGQIQIEAKSRFSGLANVDEGSITSRAKSAKSTFEKLASKAEDGNIDVYSEAQCEAAIGDGYGTRIKMDDVNASYAQEQIDLTLQDIGLTQKEFVDYMLGKTKYKGEIESQLSFAKTELLETLKTEQSQNIVERLVSLINEADKDTPEIITELNNYGSETASYFTKAQLNEIAKAYHTKYGKQLDIVTKCEAADFPDASYRVINGKYEYITEHAVFKDSGSQKPSGYTTSQMNTKHVLENNSTVEGELQIRGKQVNDFAEVEHIPYDIRKEKIKETDTEYSQIYSLIKDMDIDAYNQYNSYLSQTYETLRLRELGFLVKEDPKIENFLAKFGFSDDELKLLSKEGLQMLKYGTIKETK